MVKHWEDWNAWKVAHGIRPIPRVGQKAAPTEDNGRYILVYIFMTAIFLVGFALGALIF